MHESKMKVTMQIRIGTSGWHYSDWTGAFYPPDVTGYHELAFYARQFKTVENNASFYRIAHAATYKIWDKMTPDGFIFSMKLNKFITHTHRLDINDEVIEKIHFILDSAQVLQEKLGAMLVQMPASFRVDLPKLDKFLAFFTAEVRKQHYAFDIAIELRNSHWFTSELYTLLKKHNVALVAGNSSRWPGVRQVTADVVYIRMHGPEKLFASKYTTAQLEELASYVSGLPASVRTTYVYFNNDFHGYALEHARQLQEMLLK